MGLAMGVGSLCGGLSMPILTSLSMRFGIRRFMISGAVVGGLSMASMGQFSQLWVFTLAYSLLWISGQACGGAIGNALMSNWFVRFRGRAFGFANAGTSISGAVLPLIMLMLVQQVGVGQATLLTGAVILCVLPPLCWFLVQDTPEAMHLAPDNEAQPHAQLRSNPVITPWSWRAYFTYSKANRLGLAFGLGLMASAGVLGQLKPRFSDMGFGSYEAMGLMCLTALCAALGKILWGWLSDRMRVMLVVRLLFTANICGLGLALIPPAVGTVLLFVLVGGLAIGGFWTMYPAAVAHLFGQEGFMAAYRHTSIFLFLKSPGYVIAGLAFEWTGGYDAAYIIFMGILMLAMPLLHKLEK